MSANNDLKSLLHIKRIPICCVDKMRRLTKEEAADICFDFPEGVDGDLIVVEDHYAFTITWQYTGEVLAHVRGDFIWEESGGFFDLGHTFDETLNKRDFDLVAEVISAMFCEDLIDEQELTYNVRDHKFVNKT